MAIASETSTAPRTRIVAAGGTSRGKQGRLNVKHPPPWTVTVDPQDGWSVLRFANGETVFATSDKELIEQIALACNSHETLVAACRKFLDVWKRAGPLGSHQFEKFDVVLTMMDAALALAEPQAAELTEETER